MTKLEAIEKEITQLSRADFEKFRTWFFDRDNDLWDKQIENDVANGKLDGFAEAALREHDKGKSRKI